MPALLWAHCGQTKTREAITGRFYWTGMPVDINEQVSWQYIYTICNYCGIRSQTKSFLWNFFFISFKLVNKNFTLVFTVHVFIKEGTVCMPCHRQVSPMLNYRRYRKDDVSAFYISQKYLQTRQYTVAATQKFPFQLNTSRLPYNFPTVSSSCDELLGISVFHCKHAT